MSENEDSFDSRETSTANCSVLEIAIENVDNEASVTSTTDTLSQGTQLNDSKSQEEMPMITDTPSLSMPFASVSFVPERILENQFVQETALVAPTLESCVPGDAVNVHDINTLLNSKDTRVMYISPDVFVFDHSGLSTDTNENIPILLDPSTSSMTSISAPSDTTLNSNYLVVVENIDGSQVLTTTSMPRSLVLSPGSDIPISQISPQAHISFNSTGSEEGSKHVTDFTQSTVTMVLDDASSHLNAKEILMKPSSFITYADQAAVTSNQLTFHAVHSLSDKQDSSKLHSYEPITGSFIDISSLNVVAAEIQSGETMQHTSTTEASLFNAQTIQDTVIQMEPGKGNLKQNILEPGHELLITDVSIASNLAVQQDNCCDKQNENCEFEQVKKERFKQELRFLEQCHLEHHLKQVKKTYFVKHELENDFQEFESVSSVNQTDMPVVAATGHEHLVHTEINDETPIFSSITATLNSSVLTHLPGCQQFLLNTAQENSSFGFDIEFTSETNCTFTGTLKSLVILHNILKSVMKLKSKTILQFCNDKSKQNCLDKVVMCDLLKPYISLRGRQPKCSLKAAEMGFINNIDLYLQSDTGADIVDKEYREDTDEQKRSVKYKRKRKRGSYNKNVKNKVQKLTVKYIPEINNVIKVEEETDCENGKNTSQADFEISEVDEVAESEIVIKNSEGQESVQMLVSSTEADLTDPLQQRLLEEQLKYKKIVNKKKSQIVNLFDDDGTVSASADLNVFSSKIDRDDTSNLESSKEIFEEAQENTALSEMATGKAKRGRPRKIYNHLCMREKVHARNPLTETAATKQQRNYEEQVSFKFFCHQCSFKTKRHSHFVSHMRCHKDGTEKKYTCKQCEFVTISIPMLKRHELKHSKSLFKCGICAAYTTDRQELLRRHFRMKHSIDHREALKGKLNCDRCRYSCLTSEELEKHKTVHNRLNQTSEGDIFNCADCKKTFRSRMHLQRHIRDVHGPEVRPHLCDKCGKAFKRTDALQQHKLVHMSRTARSFPFKCTSCDKGFRSPAHLKEHMSMHSSERPYLCQYCGAAFKTQPVQKKHILTLHIRPRAHVCSVCCRQFNTRHALQRHENTHAKPDSATEAAVLVIERENAMAEKQSAMRENNTLANEDNQSTCLSVNESSSVNVEGQMSNCLVNDIISTGTVDEPMEQTGPTLQQAYIQGAQDGTLYYLTGELPAL